SSSRRFSTERRKNLNNSCEAPRKSLLSEWAALGVIAGIALVLQPVLALLIKAFFNRKKKKSQ
ncbi:MAG: hypothetical protein ACI4JT_01855, partial [Oscillospiraceae bacterium]